MNMKIEERKETALFAFRNGFNCAQAVISGFQDIVMDYDSAIKLSGGFGGGMGRLQKTCGAVTGSFMVISAFNSGRMDDKDLIKSENQKMIQSFNERFVSEFGSSDCRELIMYDLNTDEGRQKIKVDNLSEKVCEKCIVRSVEIFSELSGISRST